MAQVLPPAQFDELVETTLANYTFNDYVDISMPLQRYHFASRWFRSKERPKKGGTMLEWKLRVGNQGTGTVSGLYAVDKVNRKNVVTHGRADWSKQSANYVYDIDEPAFNGGPARIVDEMILNEQGLYNDFFELMEWMMWTAPASSDLNPMPVSGIPFFIQKSSVAALGWNGGDPSGWSAGVGGIATGTYPRWKNLAGQYKQVSDADLLTKITNAMDACSFEPVRPFPDITGGSPDWGLYGVHPTLEALRRLQKAGNDSVSNDVGHARSILINGVPFEWVPALSNSESLAYDSTQPVYGINWRSIEFFFQEGKDMQVFPPRQAPLQTTGRIRVLNNWGNFCCYNRRLNFVLHNPDASTASDPL